MDLYKMREFSDWNQGPATFSRRTVFSRVRYESAGHRQYCGKSGNNYLVVLRAEQVVYGIVY